MTRISYLLVGVLFVLAIGVIGFVIGATIGGRCCVPAGSRLAGGAIVFGYGPLGSIVTAVIAILLARALPSKHPVAATLIVRVVGGVFAGVMAKVYVDLRTEMREHMTQAYASMLKFRVALVLNQPGIPGPRSNAFDWGQKQYKLSVNNQRCVVELQPEDAAKIRGALREVEGFVYRDLSPCVGMSGSLNQVLDMYIPEVNGESSKAKLENIGACLGKYPDLGVPVNIATYIFKRSEIPAECPVK